MEICICNQNQQRTKKIKTQFQKKKIKRWKNQKFSSCLLFCCLVVSFDLSLVSLSVFFLCLSLSLSICLRVMLCVMLCGSACGVCGVCVRCGCVVWHAEQPPCVRPNRSRVCWNHAHMLKHMCAWCRYTRKRFERTHRGKGRSQILWVLWSRVFGMSTVSSTSSWKELRT